MLKSLYDMSKIDVHWFDMYQKHHIWNLDMIVCIYDSCLLYKNDCDQRFEIIKLQTDNTLIL